MIKRWIKTSPVTRGILRLAARTRKGVAILFYHSVQEDPAKQAQSLGEIVHSTAVFRCQMQLLARDYNPVTLDDALAFVQGSRDLPPRPVVVTFDDGYLDNLELAAPIMSHFGIPGVFYITVDCVENQKLPWPARLRHAFLTTSKDSWMPAQGLRWPLSTSAERSNAFLKACDLCAPLAGSAQEQFVGSIESALEVDSQKVSRGVMMTWPQVRQLAEQGHAIGSHTLTHPNIAYIPDDLVKTELADSKKKLEAELGSPILHFAYPGPARRPNWSKLSHQVSRDVGYATATTIETGPVRRHDDPLCLRRLGPGATPDELRWRLDCTFLGRRI
ncbi:MAG TPA: polysaccharide deacetylase family protein [Terriglobales bacterium]|jgi:peptidoglycan/xylan/chitin deacetylase (PgdA/CDA1 family)